MNNLLLFWKDFGLLQAADESALVIELTLNLTVKIEN
jgi:hypothetical protein